MHGNNDTNIQTNIHGGSSSVVNLDYPVAAHTAASWAWSLLLLYGHGVLSVPKYLYQLGILNIHLHPAKYTNLPLPTFQLGQVDSGRGSPQKKSTFSGPDRQTSAWPTSKKPLPLHSWRPLKYPTNSILTALHFQGSKFNIYRDVHFHWVNKRLNVISCSKWKCQWSM